MADRFKLAENNFKLVPAGEEVNLKITKTDAKPKANPTVIEVQFAHEESGAFINNKYDLTKEGGLIAFSILARCVLGRNIEDFCISEDLHKLDNKVVECEVVHTEYNGNTYANVKKTKRMVEAEEAPQAAAVQDEEEDL